MTTNAWSRAARVDCLDVVNARSRAWSFYWPGHTVIEPRTDGITWNVRGDGYPVPLGCVLVAPPGAGHVGVLAQAGASFRVLFERRTDVTVPAPGRVFLPQLWARGEGPTGSDALFDGAIGYLGAVAPVSIRISPLVSRAQRWLSASPEDPIVLRDLGAQLGGLDRCHLCRSFHRALGLPPMRFRAHLRIVRARQLLAEGNDCTTVAVALGFCDQSHFARAFRDLTGATPTAYKRSCGPQ